MGYILGLGGPYFHDASACLVDEGGIVAFAEEERFTRRKHNRHSRSCSMAAAYCLSSRGLRLCDVDEVVVAWNPDWPHRTDWVTDESLITELLDPAFFRGEMVSRLAVLPHHEAHAASAFHTSGLDNAAVVVADGSGDGQSTTIWRGGHDGLHLLREYSFSQSLGWFYESVAEHLGLGDWTSAGKLMGLAAYGKPVHDLKILQTVGDGYVVDLSRYGLTRADEADDHYADLRYYWALKRAYAAAFEDIGIPRQLSLQAYDPAQGGFSPSVRSPSAFADLAASAQHVLEDCLLAVVKFAIRASGVADVCLAGGVALNCTANGYLKRQSGARRLFIQPAAGDAGCAVGAALEWARRTGVLKLPLSRLRSMALGPSFADGDIADELRRSGISFSEPNNGVAASAAALLAQGRVGGWFQGRAEGGPRALGQRSILAVPGATGTRDYVNRSIKRRELWRPLAPSLLVGEAERLIGSIDDGEADFMIVAYQASETGWARMPATVHIDGTVRPQLVDSTRPALGPYYDLLCHLKGETDVGAVLNTSFNVDAEPIVNRPSDAIRTFYSTPLDFLAIGPFIVTKP